MGSIVQHAKAKVFGWMTLITCATSMKHIQAAVAGIEPATGRLTAAYPYQHGYHRNYNVSQDGWI
jgi:hypothetical protein